MWFDEVIDCMQCNNKKLDPKTSSYWVVPGSGSLVYCETCWNNPVATLNGENVNYVHPPVHYIKGVCDKEE